jgi:DNA-directed RNA polymerase I subunit RPA12
MALVGTLLFCEDCGDLLDRCPLEQRTISCNVCEKENISKRPYHDSVDFHRRLT